MPLSITSMIYFTTSFWTFLLTVVWLSKCVCSFALILKVINIFGGKKQIKNKIQNLYRPRIKFHYRVKNVIPLNLKFETHYIELIDIFPLPQIFTNITCTSCLIVKIMAPSCSRRHSTHFECPQWRITYTTAFPVFLFCRVFPAENSS